MPDYSPPQLKDIHKCSEARNGAHNVDTACSLAQAVLIRYLQGL